MKGRMKGKIIDGWVLSLANGELSTAGCKDEYSGKQYEYILVALQPEFDDIQPSKANGMKIIPVHIIYNDEE